MVRLSISEPGGAEVDYDVGTLSKLDLIKQIVTQTLPLTIFVS